MKLVSPLELLIWQNKREKKTLKKTYLHLNTILFVIYWNNINIYGNGQRNEERKTHLHFCCLKKFIMRIYHSNWLATTVYTWIHLDTGLCCDWVCILCEALSRLAFMPCADCKSVSFTGRKSIWLDIIRWILFLSRKLFSRLVFTHQLQCVPFSNRWYNRHFVWSFAIVQNETQIKRNNIYSSNKLCTIVSSIYIIEIVVRFLFLFLIGHSFVRQTYVLIHFRLLCGIEMCVIVSFDVCRPAIISRCFPLCELFSMANSEQSVNWKLDKLQKSNNQKCIE